MGNLITTRLLVSLLVANLGFFVLSHAYPHDAYQVLAGYVLGYVAAFIQFITKQP